MYAKDLPTLKIQRLSQAQYEREESAGNIDENSIYLTPEVDYVIAQGTSGNWTYRKWESGIAEVWGVQTLNRSNDNGLYISDIALPFNLVSSPSVNVTPSYISYPVYGVPVGLCRYNVYGGVQTFDFWIRMLKDDTHEELPEGFTSDVSVQIKGRWK